MRKVSYTQMRAELSDILDAIRNGESIVVTQRGRPNTVLKGSLHEEHSQSGDRYEISRDRNNNISVVKKMGNGQIVDVTRFDSRVSFDEALDITRKKHAKIIKALEDK